VDCPCCGYATLVARNVYNVCRLCNWEDDGQDDVDADAVRRGPNAGHSLAQARANFKRFRVMYAPGRDPRTIGATSELEFTTKGRLMVALERLRRCQRSEIERINLEVAGLERILYEEALRRVLAYDRARLGAPREGAIEPVPAPIDRPSSTATAGTGRWLRSLRKLVTGFDLG
jgi:hypothetical protein